jgi:putative protease
METQRDAVKAGVARLRILSPIDRAGEVEPLCQAGADELYGGVVPDGWRSHGISPNQRTFAEAQFSSEASFAEAVAAAKKLGVGFHLALNSPLYPHDKYPELLALAERSAAWGVQSLIVGDLGLLLRLHERKIPIAVTLSTMAGALNRSAVDFYRDLGVRRIVLPRHLCLDEMAALVAHAPDIEFEAFALIGKCPNEEAFCSFQHTSPVKRWPCEIPYRLTLAESGKAPPAGHPLVRWHRGWAEADRRFGCGLCAIDRLQEMGVHLLKLVGRGGPTEGKVANIRLVRRFVEEGVDREKARQAYKERFGRECTSYICYFPELHPDRIRLSAKSGVASRPRSSP